MNGLIFISILTTASSFISLTGELIPLSAERVKEIDVG